MRCAGYIGAWVAGGWVALPRPRVPKFSKTNRPDSPYLCGPGFILFLRFRFRFIFLFLSLYFISGCFCPALYLLYIRAMPPALHPLDTAELAPYMSAECRTATAAARTTTVLRLVPTPHQNTPLNQRECAEFQVCGPSRISTPPRPSRGLASPGQ